MKPILGLLAAILLILLVGFGVARYIADRQPATIRDIPVYHGANQASTGNVTLDGLTCPTLTFWIAESDIRALEEFYWQNMLSRGWVGGGDVEFPTPLLFARKVPGYFQTLELIINADQPRVRVEARLCNPK